MKLLVLLLTGVISSVTTAAVGYVDKNGNPAPNPCKNGENVYYSNLIFNCIDGVKVYYGCKFNGVEMVQDKVQDENNLRTQYCHKEGNSVKTTVLGCVTDDNQLLTETKTVTQADGSEFACTKEGNGFSYIKKSPPTKVSECALGQTKVIGTRYVLTCQEETPGYFTYKLSGCYSTPDDEKTKIDVGKTHDDYVSPDGQLGFRYSCYAQVNTFYYDPIGCLLGKEVITPGNIFQNKSLTVMCMREGSNVLRLRPVYSSASDDKTCTEAKTYIEENFKYECVPGQVPKAVACVFFKNGKEIPIGDTYNEDKAYQYKCQQTTDAKHLALVKIACLDDENQILAEGGKKSLLDGSRIECRRSTDNDLIRVIVGGKEPVKQCTSGEKTIRDYLQYKCQENGSYKPFACAPLNNDSLVIEIGKTYDSESYQYKCEEQGTSIIYHAVACLDPDRKPLAPGETRQVKIFTYECQRRADNSLVLVIWNDKGCKHPTLQGKLVRPNDIIEVAREIKGLQYKTLFQCRSDKPGYHLVDYACKVDGKKYDLGAFVPHNKEVYKCVREILGYVHLIYLPGNSLQCRYGNKVYNTGEEFTAADGVSIYVCQYGVVVKAGCYVHGKRIPVNQLMYCNNDPYFCPGTGAGVIPIPFRGCLRKNGKLMLLGESFTENDVVYSCTYTHYNYIYKPVIVPIGCSYNGKVIPLNSYSFDSSKGKYIVCEVDNSFTVIVHPATPNQENCINTTASYNCGSNGNEGGEVTPGPGFTATPDNGNGDTVTPGEGTSKAGTGNGIEEGLPTDEKGNIITTTPFDHTATRNTDEHENGGSTQTTKKDYGTSEGGEFPDEDKTTTAPNSSTDEEDCDDSTTPTPGPNGGDSTTTTPSSNGGDSTTTPNSNGGDSTPTPTEDDDCDDTEPPSYTATPNTVDHSGPGEHTGSTKPGNGNGGTDPFPTDEYGSTITPHGYTATPNTVDHSGPGEQTGSTTPGRGTGETNPFPTDEFGSTVTYPPGYTATPNTVDHTGPSEQPGTTKPHGETDETNPFPTDEFGSTVTYPPGYTATLNTIDHSGPGEHTGSTEPGGRTGETNPFPTDEFGSTVTPHDHTGTGEPHTAPHNPDGSTLPPNGNTDPDYTATPHTSGYTDPEGEPGTTHGKGETGETHPFPTGDPAATTTPNGPETPGTGSSTTDHRIDGSSTPDGPHGPQDTTTGHPGDGSTPPSENTDPTPHEPHTPDHTGPEDGSTTHDPNHTDHTGPIDPNESTTPHQPDDGSSTSPPGGNPSDPTDNPPHTGPPGEHSTTPTDPNGSTSPHQPVDGSSTPDSSDHPPTDSPNGESTTHDPNHPNTGPVDPTASTSPHQPVDGSSTPDSSHQPPTDHSSPIDPNESTTPHQPEEGSSTPGSSDHPPTDHTGPNGEQTTTDPNHTGPVDPNPTATPHQPVDGSSTPDHTDPIDGSTTTDPNHPNTGPVDPTATPHQPVDGSSTPDSSDKPPTDFPGPSGEPSTHDPNQGSTGPINPEDTTTSHPPGEGSSTPDPNGQPTTHDPNHTDHTGPINPEDTTTPHSSGGDSSTPDTSDHPPTDSPNGESTTHDPNHPNTGPVDPTASTSSHQPGEEGSTTPNPNGNTDPNPPVDGSTTPPSSGEGSTTPSGGPPTKCKDLLPKEVCRLLAPVCLPQTMRKAAATLENKNDRDALLIELDKSKSLDAAATSFIAKNALPADFVKRISLPVTTTVVNKPAPVNQVNCIALQEQCISNTEPSACTNYFSLCSKDLSLSVCKTTTTCTTTKEIYKIVTGEIISKLCPETCLVKECYDNHGTPGDLNLSTLINHDLLMCLLA